jgi:hypothetical protein
VAAQSLARAPLLPESVDAKDPATTPIAGWLLSNSLDASLVFYDANGVALGELEQLDRSLSSGGSGTRWVQAPGLPSRLGAMPDLANPHFERFARSLMDLGAAGTNALSQLLWVIDAALTSVHPLGGWQEQSLSWFIGRPLAVVRATVRFDLARTPAFDHGFAALDEQIRSGCFDDRGFTQVPFTVMLGDTRRAYDGLIGYFINDDYTRFFVAQYGVTPPVSTYAVPSAPIPLTLDPNASAVSLTMIVDPRAKIHATSGILPVGTLALPAEQTAAALANIAVTFVVGPVVTDSRAFAAPVPGTGTGDWTWLSHPTLTDWPKGLPLRNVDGTARLTPSPQEIVDGWYKLSHISERGRRR